MNPIDRPGAFRGIPQEWGVGETKNGYPQFVARIKATEYFDADGTVGGKAGEWIDWSEYDQEIIGYFVLYTKDAKSGQWKELLNAQQIKKAFGWSGASFTALSNGNYSDKKVLIRVDPNEYNGNTTLQVSWIDVEDASPNREMAKYDASKLSALDQKFAGVMVPAPTPVAAPKSAVPAAGALAGAPVAKPKGKPGRPPKAGPPATAAPTNTPSAGTTAPLTPPPTAKPAPTPAAQPDETACTKEQAWDAIMTTRTRDTEKYPDEKMAEIWVEEVCKINDDEDKITPVQWWQIRCAVMDRTNII
jgi:hypothetical protein